MTEQPTGAGGPAGVANAVTPLVVERAEFQAELDRLREREKAHTHPTDHGRCWRRSRDDDS